MTELLQDELRAQPIDGTFTLAGHAADATPLVDSKSQAKKDLEGLRSSLFDHHELMYANADRAVLLVLQGTDASGKNGVIKHVVSAVNPAGLSVSSFDAPDEEEKQHQFLWRIEPQAPEPGSLAVFNRSHYEDVIVPIAEGALSNAEIDVRFDDIAAFEKRLIADGVTIVKCLLHLSYDEQRERFLRRLRRPDKRWKFNESDLETRLAWDAYQAAFGEVVARTSTDDSPWYIIPADHKWYRNWAVARLLDETWDACNLEYPQPQLDLTALHRSLENK